MKVLAERLDKSLLISIFGTSNIFARHKIKPRFYKIIDQQVIYMAICNFKIGHHICDKESQKTKNEFAEHLGKYVFDKNIY